MNNPSNNKNNYNASNIQVLEGLEAVRTRPAMYIGSTGIRGLHHLVYEVLDNSIDEVLAGYCKIIHVMIHTDNSITVLDDGRGIPVEPYPDERFSGISTLEIVLTKLHAGGKFDKKSYKVSGGLHGVGISCVNALSDLFTVEVYRNGNIYIQSYSLGKPLGNIKEIGKTNKQGTKITFHPDPTIFSVVDYSFEILQRKLKELAFLNAGVNISIVDERSQGSKEITFQYNGGIRTFVEHLNSNKKVINKTPIYFKGSKNNVNVEVSIQYNTSYKECVLTFANSINTVDGGTHLSGFRSALTRSINDYIRKKPIPKRNREIKLTGEDIREGLTAVVAVKLPNPQFEGQTKAKLVNSDIDGIVQSIVSDAISIFLEENPDISNKLLDKMFKAAEAREASRKARDLTRQKSILDSVCLPGKLAECSLKDPAKTELFIVEGDSAGGSAKQGRDRTFQAILPLRGKILNVEKSSPNKLLANEEIKTLITAIGVGLGQTKDQFNVSVNKIRYHKIIIMTDADIDGAHIRTLLLTFFYRHMPILLEHGFIYIAQPPLYKVTSNKHEIYLRTYDELHKYLFTLPLNNICISNVYNNKEHIFNSSNNLYNILIYLSECDILIKRLEKQNITWQDYLRFTKQKSFPMYKIINDDSEDQYIYSEEELKKYKCQFNKRHITTLSKNDNDSNLTLQFEYTSLHDILKLNHVINNLKDENFIITETYDDLHNKCHTKYKIKWVNNKYLLNTDYNIYSIVELLKIIKDIGNEMVTIQRYKGLGEMNPDQLWATTMNKTNRKLLKVKLNQNTISINNTFLTLMGDNVDSRRIFIKNHALDVQSLDI
ncbi:MAG: DNA topoisomerase (ATP-hydrolyzing) subunit B [Endomicrobium sp.]|jgi:DNA gyrase subunit B|nr:DNA topoisomerase (ATP-hydrolyzing) subunit B [Endomicrobium sp.]